MDILIIKIMGMAFPITFVWRDDDFIFPLCSGNIISSQKKFGKFYTKGCPFIWNITKNKELKLPSMFIFDCVESALVLAVYKPESLTVTCVIFSWWLFSLWLRNILKIYIYHSLIHELSEFHTFISFPYSNKRIFSWNIEKSN